MPTLLRKLQSIKSKGENISRKQANIKSSNKYTNILHACRYIGLYVQANICNSAKKY
jgi:hypothetical protein